MSGDGLQGMSPRLPGPRPHLDEDTGAPVVGYEIELARIGAILPPVAGDDPKTETLEKVGGEVLGVTSEARARGEAIGHGRSSQRLGD